MNAAPKILIADDTPANLSLLTDALEPHGYEVLATSDGVTAIKLARRAAPDVILLDVMMPGCDGFDVCRELKRDTATREVPVIFITAKNDTATLVEGFRLGAVDYILKPFVTEEVLSRVATHLKLSRLTRELVEKNQALADANEALTLEMARREQAEHARARADERASTLAERETQRWDVAGFVGRSRTVAKIIADLGRLRTFSSTSVLITGESGTGKELIARAIHYGSARAKETFIPVNCVAIPSELAESMMFGHLRGAFTGATMDRKGYFELADGGTLFLDEIGDMPATLQAKLLRVLEDGCVTPIGAAQSKRVDVRIVAATNADLDEKIAAGTFRQDLYFRLARYAVHLPPLRERREDIPLLAAHFLAVFANEMGLKTAALQPCAAAVLEAHDFPGNVRELRNVMERALIESGGGDVLAKHLHVTRRAFFAPPSAPAENLADLPLSIDHAEEVLIQRALAQTSGNIAEAARLLGINRSRIYRRISQESGTPAR